MKQKWIIVLSVLFILSGRVFALDLSLIGGAGNMAFDDERLTALNAGTDPFGPNFFPLGRIELSGNYAGYFSFKTGIDLDPILRNRFISNIIFDLDFLSLEVGPFIGLFNSEEKPVNQGMTASLGLELPGIVFARIGAASTMGASINAPGDYAQETGEFALGFWIPYVICTLSLNTKSFTLQKEQNLLVKDDLTEYNFRAEIYSKNTPYLLQVDLGYQSLKRSYTAVGVVVNAGTGTLVKENAVDELKSVYTGFELIYSVNTTFKLILGAKLPVYSWGEPPLKSPEKGTFLFQAHAGFTITFPEA
jgi:hypothetical protein